MFQPDGTHNPPRPAAPSDDDIIGEETALIHNDARLPDGQSSLGLDDNAADTEDERTGSDLSMSSEDERALGLDDDESTNTDITMTPYDYGHEDLLVSIIELAPAFLGYLPYALLYVFAVFVVVPTLVMMASAALGVSSELAKVLITGFFAFIVAKKEVAAFRMAPPMERLVPQVNVLRRVDTDLEARPLLENMAEQPQFVQVPQDPRTTRESMSRLERILYLTPRVYLQPHVWVKSLYRRFVAETHNPQADLPASLAVRTASVSETIQGHLLLFVYAFLAAFAITKGEFEWYLQHNNIPRTVELDRERLMGTIIPLGAAFLHRIGSILVAEQVKITGQGFSAVLDAGSLGLLKTDGILRTWLDPYLPACVKPETYLTHEKPGLIASILSTVIGAGNAIYVQLGWRLPALILATLVLCEGLPGQVYGLEHILPGSNAIKHMDQTGMYFILLACVREICEVIVAEPQTKWLGRPIGSAILGAGNPASWAKSAVSHFTCGRSKTTSEPSPDSSINFTSDDESQQSKLLPSRDILSTGTYGSISINI